MGVSVRSPEIEDAIIAGLTAGRPLTELCREQEIGVRTVYDWRDADDAFAARFARAREAGFDALAEECIAIAEDGSNDWMERTGKDGESLGWQLNGEHVQRSKLRIETRLKLLAKWDPKRYGEKLDVDHSGSLSVVIRKPGEAAA